MIYHQCVQCRLSSCPVFIDAHYWQQDRVTHIVVSVKLLISNALNASRIHLGIDICNRIYCNRICPCNVWNPHFIFFFAPCYNLHWNNWLVFQSIILLYFTLCNNSWCHQMETFPRYLCAGKSPVIGESPSQRPVTWSFDFSLICAWTDWVNNRHTNDFKRHCAHYYVTEMGSYYPLRI